MVNYLSLIGGATTFAALLAVGAAPSGRLLEHDLLHDAVQEQPVLRLRIILHWGQTIVQKTVVFYPILAIAFKDNLYLYKLNGDQSYGFRFYRSLT